MAVSAGAQFVGMGRRVLAAAPEMRALYDEASALLGTDLLATCLQGPAETLNSTVVTQPATFIPRLAALALLKQEFPDVCPLSSFYFLSIHVNFSFFY